MTTAFQSNTFQNDAFQIDAVIATIDTHDGFDEEVKKQVREEENAFRSKRDLLREVIEQAWDGPSEPVAAQVRAIATPYVERLESGALRIDYAAMEKRNAAVMAEVLAFQNALRSEFEARMAFEEDEEDVMLLLSTWS